MAGETPDYRRLSAQTRVFPMNDLGELAARLGSINTFYRGGDVVFMEDFEAGLTRWATAVGGTGSLVQLSRVRNRSGLLSVQLRAGSTDSQRADIERRAPLPQLSLVGFEASFFHQGLTESVALRLDHRDAIRQRQYELRWRQTEMDLQVLADTGSYVTVATAAPLIGFPEAHATMKLVVDLVNNRYVRASLNRFSVDVSAHNPQDVAASTLDELRTMVRHIGASGTPSCWVDDVILTENEPLL